MRTRLRKRKSKLKSTTREGCTLSMATLSRIKSSHPQPKLLLHQEYQRTHQADSLKLKFAERKMWQNTCSTTSEARWRFLNLPSSRPMQHTQPYSPTCISNCTKTTRACMKLSSRLTSKSSNKPATKRNRRWIWQLSIRSSTKTGNQFYCQ